MLFRSPKIQLTFLTNRKTILSFWVMKARASPTHPSHDATEEKLVAGTEKRGRGGGGYAVMFYPLNREGR